MIPVDGVIGILFLQVAGTNVVLSADNAVVVAMALKSLPRERQRSAMLGACLAIAASRIALTFLAAGVLTLPYLRIVGALLLGWIGVQLLRGDEAESTQRPIVAATLARAIGAVLIADTVMSLDNVVAVAGAAEGSGVALVLGLGASIPLIIVGAAVLASVVERFPVIVYIGAALIGSVAGGMLAADPWFDAWFAPRRAVIDAAARLTGALLVVGIGTWANTARRVRNR